MNPALRQQPNFVSRSPGFLAISSQLKGYVTTHLKDKLVHKKPLSNVTGCDQFCLKDHFDSEDPGCGIEVENYV